MNAYDPKTFSLLYSLGWAPCGGSSGDTPADQTSTRGARAMTTLTRAITLAFAVLLFSAPLVHAASGEQWEYSMSIVAPDGSSTPMNTLKACRSASAALMPAPQSNCKVEDFKSSGHKASYRLVCGPPQAMTMNGEVTRNGDTASGTVRMQQNGQEMVMKQSSRKLGSCTNPID